MTSALIIDDHPIILNTCRRLLKELGVEMIYEASDVLSGFELYETHSPDVAVVDLTFKGDDLEGLWLISKIARSDKKAKVLVFSMHSEAAIVLRALKAGATGFVLKDAQSDDFSVAFKQTAEGKGYLSYKLALAVASFESPTRDLDDRHLQLLEALGEGINYRQIADRLEVSLHTVVNLCSSLREKLNLTSHSELVNFAVRNDLRQRLRFETRTA